MKIARILIIMFASLLQARSDDATFRSFQIKHNKTYASANELTLRQQIYQNNLQKIKEHNKKYEQGLSSYKMGVNKFSDLTEEEFAARFKTWKLNDTIFKTGSLQDSSKLNVNKLPVSMDWREKGVVTDVKYQELCGACWAFSATGTIEAQLAILTGNLTSLSEQELLDCDENNNGCSGGIVQNAIVYVAQNGLTSEENYPYIGVKQTCKKTKKRVALAKSFVNIRQYNETDLKLAVGLIGPVSVAINAGPLQSYKTGIFDGTCSNEINHAVLVVGYGRDSATNKDYWIIKNSWGTTWGEEGYVRLAMNRGLCGVARQACYPIGVTNAGFQNRLTNISGAILLLIIASLLCNF